MKLSDKLSTLLLIAVKNAGSYDPDEAIWIIEEQLTLPEYHAAMGFLGWVNTGCGRQFGRDNIQQRFTEWRNRED